MDFHPTTASSESTLVQSATSAVGGEAFVDLRTQIAWTRCFDQLREIQRLRDDWDGAGAPRIDAAIIRSAFDILLKLGESDFHDPPNAIVASPSGTVVIEWYTTDQYVGGEIERPYSVEWMIKRNGFPAIHKSQEFTPAHRHMESQVESVKVDEPSDVTSYGSSALTISA